MQNAFFEKSGENAELLSDLGARFQAVASELFNLACYSDFVLRQAFIQSADGEYLDKHAALRNMQRKTASKAQGEITFYAAEISEENITVPAGTICSVEDSEYLQFVTTRAVTIYAGEECATAPAEAIESGSAYNVKAGKITVIVNPPGSVTRAENAFDFTGGWDDESDESLRKRLCDSYSVPPTGLSAKSIAECVMKIDEVLDSNIVLNAVGTLLVYVKTKHNRITPALEEEINNALLVAYVTVTNTFVAEAMRREYDLKITVESTDGDSETAIREIKKAVKNYTDGIKIGESVSLAEIYHLASFAAPVKNCVVASSHAANGIIAGREDSYLIPEEITVECYE